ncbi:MRP-family nucleotide-binding protein [Giardia duodenalis]|uniref:MRP-family nucleotide-binding protein n=1 Tax=Giardia intestinalis TaxID=5741 RepID=V6U0M4_GIAIN|nr:MRP-family nucleotide-binding protein [Giardia intestinalis]
MDKSMGTTTEDSAQLTCMRCAKAYRAVTFCQANERQH